jgi:hypothetical protein
MKIPKEKAIELVNRFHIVYTLNNLEAKQCALIAVDEVIKDTSNSDYWQEVRNEIEKL